jgi:hypothetical protein
VLDLNPNNRPNSIEIKELIGLFNNSLDQYNRRMNQQQHEIKEQFEKTQESRKANFLSVNNKTTTHKQAVYTSRLLNPFTKNLSKYDDEISNNTVEITDFSK